MDSQLSSARKWIARTAKATAVTILPLALATVAQAGIVLAPDSPFSGGCELSGGGAGPNCNFSQLPVDPSGSQGLSWSFNTPYTWNSPNVEFVGQAVGQVSGSLPSGVLPFSWSIVATPGAYTYLSVYTYNQTTFTGDGFSSGDSSGTGTIIGGVPISDGDTLDLYFYVNAYFPQSDGVLGDTPDGVSIDSFSFQFFPVASTVPEPGTLMLMGGAMGALGLLIRRKRNTQA